MQIHAPAGADKKRQLLRLLSSGRTAVQSRRDPQQRLLVGTNAPLKEGRREMTLQGYCFLGIAAEGGPVRGRFHERPELGPRWQHPCFQNGETRSRAGKRATNAIGDCVAGVTDVNDPTAAGEREGAQFRGQS
jgi:hypothetical protein